MDAQAGAFGEYEQFGVEEPAGVLHEWEQAVGDVGAYGFEPALGVGEPGAEGAVQDQVVGPGDDLSFGAADDAGAAAEAGADREVGVSGDEWGDQGEQGGEVGGQVHVAVGEDLRV